MPKITHFKVEDSDVFIDNFDSKDFLFYKKKKEKKDYWFDNINIIFAYNGYWKSSFTALLKDKAWKKDNLWNDYLSDIKEKWELWDLTIKWFKDNKDNKGEKIISNIDIKWKVIVFDKYFVEKNLYIPSYLWKTAEKKKNEKFKNKLLLLWINIKKFFEEYQNLKDELDLLKDLFKKNSDIKEEMEEKEILEKIKLNLIEQDEIKLIDKYVENIDISISKLDSLVSKNSILSKYKIDNNINLNLLQEDIIEKEENFNNYFKNIQAEQKNISQDLEEMNSYLNNLWFSHLNLRFKDNIWTNEELTNAFVVLNKLEEINLKQLSEWELKAIWLALFFTLLNKNHNKIKDCIVIFDDPVNSYDHKKRVKLSYFIKDFFWIDNDKIKKVNQIFILTHDNLFYKFLNKSLSVTGKRTYMIDKSSIWSYIIKYDDKDVYKSFKTDLKEFIDKKNSDNNIESIITINLTKLRYVVEYTIKEEIFNESSNEISNILWWIKNLKKKLDKLDKKKLDDLQDIYNFCSAGWLHKQDDVVSPELVREYIEKFIRLNF